MLHRLHGCRVAAPTWVGLTRRQSVAVDNDVLRHWDAALLQGPKHATQIFKTENQDCIISPSPGPLRRTVTTTSDDELRCPCPSCEQAHHERAVHSAAVQQRVLRHHVIDQVRLAQRSILLCLLQWKAICRAKEYRRHTWWATEKMVSIAVCPASRPAKRSYFQLPLPPHPSASKAGSRTTATRPQLCSGWCRRQTPRHQTRRSAAVAPLYGSSAWTAPSCPWLRAWCTADRVSTEMGMQ